MNHNQSIKPHDNRRRQRRLEAAFVAVTLVLFTYETILSIRSGTLRRALSVSIPAVPSWSHAAGNRGTGYAYGLVEESAFEAAKAVKSASAYREKSTDSKGEYDEAVAHSIRNEVNANARPQWVVHSANETDADGKVTESEHLNSPSSQDQREQKETAAAVSSGAVAPQPFRQQERPADEPADEAALAAREKEEELAADIDALPAVLANASLSAEGDEQQQQILQLQRDRQFRGLRVQGYDPWGVNVTRVSYMIFRVMRMYKLTSLIDFPCSTTRHYMAYLAERLDFELQDFKYYALDVGYEEMRSCKLAFEEASVTGLSSQFDLITISDRMMYPKADLLFSFDGFQKWGPKAAMIALKALRRSQVPYVMFTNNPGAVGNLEPGLINVRRAPFHFDGPTKAIRNIMREEDERDAKVAEDLASGNDSVSNAAQNPMDPSIKVLYMYDINHMRPGLVDF
ncbi:hypothetical protein FVE85_6837 [Porphyridium purpureum]|uniref:Uncharacterized protein n=1 Tax=Porphyridium purpureum TaxID=35688 RepID=A0A5J4Z881_PORPP|nr:hypothetical protein FVE85_6837 [Porphyridium purpureum]|eukprot:POR2440..scf295_1